MEQDIEREPYHRTGRRRGVRCVQQVHGAQVVAPEHAVLRTLQPAALAWLSRPVLPVSATPSLVRAWDQATACLHAASSLRLSTRSQSTSRSHAFTSQQANDIETQEFMPWTRWNRAPLPEHEQYATHTGGALVKRELGIAIHKLQSVH